MQSEICGLVSAVTVLQDNEVAWNNIFENGLKGQQEMVVARNVDNF